MKKLILICSLVLAAFLSAPALARTTAKAPVLAAATTQQDKEDLARIEAYLNGLKTVSADFLQIDDAGGMMRGQIAIQRPGKMRVTYDPPSTDFIIADGSSVHIWDGEMQTQTNVEQDSSLAQFILRDPVKLSGDVTVTKIQRLPAKIEVSLVENKDPSQGSLTLVFEDRPLKLRQWKVVDAQGRLTGVNLENLSEGATFPERTFIFIPPSFEKNK
ncbi:MAG: outer membrane lipoprotein carrier protein LolA [Alphaproteobacteria bacterium]|nr:outer membrane lipoprotein carrier protein LolA [Alphaproteobacteria bacterium]